MPIQRCPQCGKDFERNYGDSSASLNCPECEARLARSPLQELKAHAALVALKNAERFLRLLVRRQPVHRHNARRHNNLSDNHSNRPRQIAGR